MPLKALVVDDQASIRTLVRDHLEREHGCEVVEAENGLAAVEYLLGQRVAIVISDYDMPVMNGLELIGFIKTDPLLADTPVIMLSSHAEEQDRRRVLDLGVEAFVLKPFAAETLRPLLLAALARA